MNVQAEQSEAKNPAFKRDAKQSSPDTVWNEPISAGSPKKQTGPLFQGPAVSGLRSTAKETMLTVRISLADWHNHC